MSFEATAKPALQDIKTIKVECQRCHRTRLYISTDLGTGNANDMSTSECVCAEPTKVLLRLISQARHFNLGFKLTLEF